MMRHQNNMRMQGRLARFQAYDRRLAAIHEAGHVLMAIHLGYRAKAWVNPNETGDPFGEKTWVGHMTMRGMPEERDHPHVRMVAVAGMVAEELWKNGHDEEYAETWRWEDALKDEDIMSYSDWRLAGCEPGEPDDDLHQVVATVAALFMHHLWTQLTGISRVLMSETQSIHSFGCSDTPSAVAA
ncbi:hypothetical protein [Rhizobium sp. Leaf341]|uniref:hypothetical protein n=1 Tax=Rhizobium sp. Leaf341 TaxID=1736344 RepID=UPI000712E933|nr:hypothetical protein [Rhizobium sp. Leaf341]KQR77598.1 hypothetical protein ASG03_14415 [Rhizobium sp. Leaf341]